MESKNKVFTEITERCKQTGISVSELCLRARVDRNNFQRWKVKTPNSVDVYVRLNLELNKLESNVEL
jgi:hypothetical protein